MVPTTTRLKFIQINTWIVAPYKKPERDLEENTIFNNHVSIVRIRSEHAIGYLKGRFHSLKALRIHITSRRRHIIATYWVAACIAVHSFSIQCEERERLVAYGDDDWVDPFIAEGLDEEHGSENGDVAPAPTQSCASSTRLLFGKECHEKLKRRLFHYKALRLRQRAASRRDDILANVDQ